MKYLILLSLILSPTIYSKSCVTVENGKKTLCNNYDSLKQKDPAKLKKLCSMGNMDTPYMKIKNTYQEGNCATDGAIAKCSQNGNDVTIYFSGEIADLKKGCGFLKNTVFTKL